MEVYLLVEKYNQKVFSKNIYLKISPLKLDILKNGEIYFSIYYPETQKIQDIKFFINQALKRL